MKPTIAAWRPLSYVSSTVAVSVYIIVFRMPWNDGFSTTTSITRGV